MGGEGPIPYMTLRAYAGDLGITGEDFATFRTFMTIIDHTWLEHVAARDKAARETKGGQA